MHPHACVRFTLISAAFLAWMSGSPYAHARSVAEVSNEEEEAPIDPLSDAPQKAHHFGLMFDLGTLDGGMLSLVYRPTPWLRAYGGGGANGAAPGVRLGAAVAPFHRRNWTFSLDGGHFFEGDVNGIFSAFAGARFDDNRVLEHFDYSFVNLQGGWEVEAAGLMFFARGGVGFVWTQVPPAGLDHIRHLSPLINSDGSVQALLPSLSVGFIGFF